jgi:hypothetical protein
LIDNDLTPFTLKNDDGFIDIVKNDDLIKDNLTDDDQIKDSLKSDDLKSDDLKNDAPQEMSETKPVDDEMLEVICVQRL